MAACCCLPLRRYQVWDSQSLLKCEHCHRTFVPEALAKHKKSCTPSNPARPVGYFRDAKAPAMSSPEPIKVTQKTKAFIQNKSPARPTTSFARSVSRSRQAPPPEMERPSTSGGHPGPPRPQPQRSTPRLAAYNTPTKHQQRAVPSLDTRAEPDTGGYIYTPGPSSPKPPKPMAKAGPACHECGGAYPRSCSKFCAACGSARRRASITALVWGSFCDECGRTFAAGGEKFCSACGVERSLLPPSS